VQVLVPQQDDILEWPDGTWCYRHELSDMQWMSDDYTTIPVGSERWDDFNKE